MSHVIELSDEVYKAIEAYAAKHKQTPEEVIQAWAKAASTGETATGHEAGEHERVNDPAYDPWAGFRGVTELLSEDSLDRHDAYLAQG